MANARQLVAAAGQDLVGIGLVTDVPQDLVSGRVEHAVQRDRQLAGAQVGAEVAADLSDRVDDVLAHLLRELLKLVVAQLLEVLGPVDAVEQARRRIVLLALRGHQASRRNMKSVSSSRSRASPVRTSHADSRASRARACDSPASAF